MSDYKEILTSDRVYKKYKEKKMGCGNVQTFPHFFIIQVLSE